MDYYYKNKDTILARRKIYRQETKDHISEYNRKYRETHKEYFSEYRSTNPKKQSNGYTFTCPTCNKTMNQTNRKAHELTWKHIGLMLSE